jgi:hypothetical protein
MRVTTVIFSFIFARPKLSFMREVTTGILATTFDQQQPNVAGDIARIPMALC